MADWTDHRIRARNISPYLLLDNLDCDLCLDPLQISADDPRRDSGQADTGCMDLQPEHMLQYLRMAQLD